MNKVKLAQMVTRNFLATPLWSPDESRFVINNALDGEFYTATRQGEISQISHLNRSGEDGTASERIFFSEKYSWSPDGKSLVAIGNWEEAGDFDTLLVDLEGGFAVKIAENLTPGGWLNISQK